MLKTFCLEFLGQFSAHTTFPVIELIWILSFLVLALITIFRRQLSSNDGYRLANENDKTDERTHSKIYTELPNKIRGNILHERKKDSTDIQISLDDLSLELLLNIVTFLPRTQISKLSQVSKVLYNYARSDFIWKQLWLLEYGELWKHPTIIKTCMIRNIQFPLSDKSFSTFQPKNSWRIFYFEFELCWIDWLLAGCNTSLFCLVGLQGWVCDITDFLTEHPGSPESLTESAGGDASEIFSDIGHSSFALGLAETLALRFDGKLTFCCALFIYIDSVCYCCCCC